MRQTSKGLLQEIAKLKEAAKKLQAEERLGVLKQVIAAIGVYDFTPAELGFRGNARVQAAPGKQAKPPVSARSAPRQFSDRAGNTWGGRGKRPQWLNDALAAGRTLDDFRVTPPPPAAAKSPRGKHATSAWSAPAPMPKAAAKSKLPGKPKFSDGQGNVWSGRGPRPRWLKDALASGRKESELRV